jgi:hypothetical protein
MTLSTERSNKTSIEFSSPVSISQNPTRWMNTDYIIYLVVQALLRLWGPDVAAIMLNMVFSWSKEVGPRRVKIGPIKWAKLN